MHHGPIRPRVETGAARVVTWTLCHRVDVKPIRLHVASPRGHRTSSRHRRNDLKPNVCTCLHHNVVAPQSPGYGSTAPEGRGAAPWGVDDRAPGTPTGLNKMRCPMHHGPIRPRVEMGAVRVVTWTDGATSVLSHPVGVPSRRRTRPQGTDPRLGAWVRTLGSVVPPRCGEIPPGARRVAMKTAPGCAACLGKPCPVVRRVAVTPVFVNVVSSRGHRTFLPQRYGHGMPNVWVPSPRRCPDQNPTCGMSSPQRGGTPKPRVRLHGPRGPWSRTLGRRRSGAGTPTGLNKMRCPTHHGPIRPRVAMGAVRVVTWTDGATSVLSHPVGVPSRRRTRPQGTTPRLGAWGRTLGFGVPPRCGENPSGARRVPMQPRAIVRRVAVKPVPVHVVSPRRHRACPPHRYGHPQPNVCAYRHHNVARSKTGRVHVFTTTLRPSKTERACHHHTDAPIENGTLACLHRTRGAIQNRTLACLHHNVVAPQSPGCGSTAPEGRGAVPWGIDDRAPATPTGLNKMRCPAHHGPIRPRVAMGAARVVTWTDGATSVLSHPVGVPSRRRTRPQGTTPRLGAWGRTLGFGVPPRCGENPFGCAPCSDATPCDCAPRRREARPGARRVPAPASGVSTTPLRPSTTERVCVSSPQRGAIQNRTGACLHHNVTAMENRTCGCHHHTVVPTKTQRVHVSSPQRGGTPKPRVRLHGPRGPWSRTLGRRRSAPATPTGLNKMRYRHASRPDSSAGCNGGRACGDVDGWCHVGLVAPRWGAVSTPHASPGYAPRLGAWGRTLGFGVPPRCGENPGAPCSDATPCDCAPRRREARPGARRVPAGIGRVHHTVTAIHNRTCVRIVTTTWRDPKPDGFMSSPQRYGHRRNARHHHTDAPIENGTWRVFTALRDPKPNVAVTTTWWHSKAQGTAPRPPRAVEPHPGASTIGAATPTGLNKMRCPAQHVPIHLPYRRTYRRERCGQ